MNIPEFRSRVDEVLQRQDRSEAWLARRLGYSPGQFGKWLVGANRIPYEAVTAICDVLEFPPQQQVQLMDLAGYPPPRWARPHPLQGSASSIGAALQSAGSADVQEFSSAIDYFAYARSAIAAAQYGVDDLTWGIDIPSFSQKEDDRYFEYLETIAESCLRGVAYREVMSFRNSRHYVERAVSMLQQDLMSYSLRYYDVDLLRHPPLLAVMVVDGREALVAWYRWPYLPPHAEKRIAVRTPAVVALFADYFETVWFGAKPIKNGDRVDWDEVEKVKQLWE